MIGHPREDMLLAFQDHRLDDRRRRRLAGHLSGCQRCRNVVQAHRTVRGVFALEAPFAPDGVLERALASRATGMLVLLPVAEPNPRRPMELPSRGFLVAAGLLLIMGVGVQVLPMGWLPQSFGAVGAVIEEWNSPFGGLAWNYPRPPVGDGAVLDPSRIRPLRATYQITTTQGAEELRGRTMELEVVRVAGGWRLRTTWRIRPGSAVTSAVDALLSDSLALLSWDANYRTGGALQNSHLYRFTISSDSFTESYRFVSDSGQVQPPSRRPYDSTYAVSFRERTPLAVGDGHLFALLRAAPLRRGWVGSFLDLRVGTNRYLARIPGTTFVAAGSDSITIPLGRFAAWEIRQVQLNPGMATRIWVDKNTGLVLKANSAGFGYRTETVLESVTYP